MADFPALPFGAPTRRPRTTGRGGRSRVEGPGTAVQRERLSPAFARLTEAFSAERPVIDGEPEGQEPELVLVLEIAGEIDDFARAVQRVEGLEFLAEQALSAVQPDEFAAVRPDGSRSRYQRQLFLVLSDRTAWEELLRLWARFQAGEDLPYGLTKFRDLFSNLKELRPWDDSDRVERSGARDAWRRELSDVDADEPIEFEIELWARPNEETRRRVMQRLIHDVEHAGGAVVAEYFLDEIDYHGVLGRVAASHLREIAQRGEVPWMETESIRFFHAVGQMSAVGEVNEDDLVPVEGTATPAAGGPPDVALLDGVPLTGHVLLEDRLLLDDPDDWQETTPAGRRLHGTTMASAVIHGDLNSQGSALDRPLYVRPVLRADAPDWVPRPVEELPRDRLGVDLIHSAVARLYEGPSPSAPSVRTIVLAVGDISKQVDRFVSPLARLLDWLAFRYRVVFLLAAGNHVEPLEVPEDVDGSDPEEVQHEVLCAIARVANLRRILAPAESINGVTVAAAHSDASGVAVPEGLVEPILTTELPAVTSALGGGLRRSIKPDVMLPGGRQLVRLEAASSGRRLVTLPPTARPPGFCVAAPSGSGVLDATMHEKGTSLATGLAGHYAGHVMEEARALSKEYGEGILDDSHTAAFVKAALVHGSSRGVANQILADVHHETFGSVDRASMGRSLGYGLTDPLRPLRGRPGLVTIFAVGTIAEGVADVYSFPLPPSLASQTERRRLTLTLAWLTPINPRHRLYRRAHLKLEPSGHEQLTNERLDAGVNEARRGTAQHDVLEGEAAVPYVAGSAIELAVSCRADAGALDVSVPYAVLATLEVAEGVNLPIFQEVRQAVRPSVPIRPRVG